MFFFTKQNEKQMQPYHGQNNYVSDSEDEPLSIEHRMPQVKNPLNIHTTRGQFHDGLMQAFGS